MRILRAWLRRVTGFLLPGAGEREFADELQSHLDLHTADNIRAGMHPDEARRVALVKLGSPASVSEAHRDRRGLRDDRPRGRRRRRVDRGPGRELDDGAGDELRVGVQPVHVRHLGGGHTRGGGEAAERVAGADRVGAHRLGSALARGADSRSL